MGTRGFLGIRNNEKLLDGKYNHYDSYYNRLGQEVLDLYFKGKGDVILTLTDNKESDIDFLQDGLFCEYTYIYNEEDDTLEIYRGYFESQQDSSVKKLILNALEDGDKKYYSHLIMVVDKKKHTQDEVLKAFLKYDDLEEDSGVDYPEREIIPLELKKDYVLLV